MDRTVGPYRLGDTLGALPFGELVAATHPARSEPLAVLLLDQRLAKEYRLRGLLRLENARAGGLRHPALARIIEIGEQGGTPYVVFERPASSTTLAQAIAEGTAPSPGQSMPLVRQLAEALDAAHSRRLLHGAVSPATVFVGADGGGALFGIGLLAAVEEAGLVSVFTENMADERGDARFVAPEQRTGKRSVSSADGYALGVLARTLLPGSTGLSKAADAVLTRQCADDPAARFPTCAAFVTALVEALPPAAPVEGPAPASPPPPSTPEPAAFAPSKTPLPSAPPPTSAPPSPATCDPVMPTMQTSSPAPLSTPSSASAPPQTPPTSTPPATVAPPSPATSDLATPTAQTSSPASSPNPSPSAALPLTDHSSPPANPLAHLSPPPAPPIAAPSPSAAPPPWDVPTSPLAAMPSAESRPTAAPPRVEPPAVTAPPDGLSSQDRPRTHATAAPEVLPWDTPPAAKAVAPASLPASPARPIRWSEPEGKPFTVGTNPLTDAMRAGLTRAEQRDPLGDAVRWAAGQSATLLVLLDRYCPDGKFGPIPLGIVAAMVLASVLLIARQPVLVTSVVGLVFVLYVMPRAARRLTASERPKPLAVSVAGTARVGERTVGLGWKAYEIEAANGTTLRLSPAAYQRLARIGRPVTVERPSTVAAGTHQVTVGHEIADVVVTYLASSTTLFDVRRPDGSVLVRDPAYQGEPGDSVDIESTSTVRAEPTWRRSSSRGQSIVLPMPAPIRASLERAARLQLRWLVLIAGLPLALVLLTVNTGAAGFSVIMLIGVYLTFGARALERTLKLRSARNAKVLVQVVGPVLVSHYANDKTAHYRMRLEDDAVLSIDAETHGRLARLGQMRMGEDRSVFWDERSRSEHLIGEHEVPSVTVTYEPKAPVLFEILNVFSEPVYRDPDIGPNNIPHDEPRV